MLFNWNEETIRWYLNANTYTGFYKKIAGDIVPLAKGLSTLADLGCGLGLFDFEAHPHFEKIECIDQNETALDSIKLRAEALGIRNISTRAADCYRLVGRWDAIYMSFFGTREPDCFLPFCKKLFAVVAVSDTSSMFPVKKQFNKNSVDQTVRYLKQKGIPYNLRIRRYEFGQPFTSLEDAERCVRHYVPEITGGALEEYLKDRLVETGDASYPYYVPRQKSVGIFELDGAQ